MIGALALTALLGAGTPPDAPDTGARIGAAVAAEQSLQGPLDGGWTLRDDAGRPLYRIELIDPAGGRGPLTGAWRDTVGGAGVIADARREGRRLRIHLATAGSQPTALRLTKRSPGLWTGQMMAGASRRAVVLRRD